MKKKKQNPNNGKVVHKYYRREHLFPASRKMRADFIVMDNDGHTMFIECKTKSNSEIINESLLKKQLDLAKNIELLEKLGIELNDNPQNNYFMYW